MSEYENQHYVPRFYLKKFNLSSKKEKTYVYYLGNSDKKAYPQSIKNACSDDNFYTQATPEERRKTEQLLSKIENKQSKVLKNIIKIEKIVHPYRSNDAIITPDEYESFLQFIAFQSMRTKSRKEGLKSKAREMEETFGSPMETDSILLLLLDGLFKSLASYYHFFKDLCPILIKNKTECGFITSDNPTVFDNLRFKEYGAGLSSRGLIVYLPLSPKIAVILHDPLCYSVPIDLQGRIELTNKKTIEDLNTYQILNATDCVFFSDSFQNKKEKEQEIISILRNMRQVRSRLHQRSYPPQYASKPFFPFFPQFRLRPWEISTFPPKIRHPQPVKQGKELMKKWLQEKIENAKKSSEKELYKRYRDSCFGP